MTTLGRAMKNALTNDYTDDTDAGKTYSRSLVNSLAKLLRVSSVLLLCATPALRAQREKLPPEDLEVVEKNWPKAKKTTTGIRYVILREGAGDSPKPGDKVNVL